MSSELARFYSALPHVDARFQAINSSFAPQSLLYREALVIAGGVPVACLLLTLIVLLIYLSSRCCARPLSTYKSLECQRWSLFIAAALTCGVLALGLYGNDDGHNVITRTVSQVNRLNKKFAAVETQLTALNATLEEKSVRFVFELKALLGKPISNQSLHDALTSYMGAVDGNVTYVARRVTAIASSQKTEPVLDAGVIVSWERIRWPLTMTVLSAFILLCLVLIFAVARKSRCLLILFSVFGLMGIVVNYGLSSFYLITSMALGDICVDPDMHTYILANSIVGKNYADFYTDCVAPTNASRTLLSQEEINLVRQRLGQANSSTIAFITASKDQYSRRDLQPVADNVLRSFEQAADALNNLATLLSCQEIREEHFTMIETVCHSGMLALTFMLSSAMFAAILFSLLVWIDFHLWIYLRKRQGYLQVTAQDPFLSLSVRQDRASGRNKDHVLPSAPHLTTSLEKRSARHSHTPPQTPPFPGTLNGRSNADDKSRRDTNTATWSRNSPTGGGTLLGPNNGQYPTLSKSCKTLESSDFY